MNFEELFLRLFENIFNWVAEIILEYGILIFLIALGFLFRCSLYRYQYLLQEIRAKKVVRTIATVAFLSIMWGLLYNNTQDVNVFLTTLILTFIYAFMVIAEKCGETGSTESILLIVNGIMVTTLSLQPFPHSIWFAAYTCLLAWIAYRCWPFFDFLSDFIEIVIISFEAIIASLVLFGMGWTGTIHTIIFAVFSETFLFMINCFIKYIVKIICKEDIDTYWKDIYYW